MNSRYLLLVILGLSFGSLAAQEIDYSLFTEEVYSTGWSHPTGMIFDDNGQMYVWDRFGRLYTAPNGVKPSGPTLNIEAEVGSWNDHGLLNVALDPDFLDNGHIYLLYVVNRHHLLYYGTPDYDPTIKLPKQATIGRLTRYTLDPTNNFQSVVPDSRHVILGKTIDDGFPIMHKSHGLGGLVFGRDGSLLVSCGDAAAYDGPDNGDDAFGSFALQGLADGILQPYENVGAFRAQMIDSHNGKVLRIDPFSGAGIPSNPYYDASMPASPRSRVWAMGLRNPYRMSLQPNTGSTDPAAGDPGVLFVSDVGWKRWEEINIVDVAGLNFGWPLFEGMWSEPFYRDAITEHPQAPNPLSGGDCEQDYYTFQNLLIQPTAELNPTFSHPCDENEEIGADMPRFVHRWPSLTWPNNTGSKQGIVSYPDEDTEGNPIAMPINDPASEVEGESFRGTCIIGGMFYEGDVFPEPFHASYLTADFAGFFKWIHINEENNIAAIDSFPGGIKNMNHLAYNPADECIYHLNYTDFKIYRICYGGNPAPKAIINADQFYGSAPLSIQFDASESFDPQDEPLTYEWDFGDGNTSNSSAANFTFEAPNSEPYSLWVRLTVRDSAGQASQDSILVSLNNSPPVVEINSFPDTFEYSLNGITLLPLAATVMDDEHEGEALQYAWKAFLHHNTHFHAEPTDHAVSSWASISPEGCNEETYYYRIRLEVTDEAGLVGVDENIIYPYCGDALLDWGDLTVERFDTKLKLSWDTQNEMSDLKFVVQRSEDPINFRPISERLAGGQNSYSYEDTQPIFGQNYYRIAAVRADGFEYFSQTLKVAFPPPPAFEVFPNPASRLLNVQMRRIYGKGELILSDINGKVVLRQQWEAETNDFTDQILIEDLPLGLYFYQLDNGQSRISGKIFKTL
ncbi:MAG: PQQ-dependent sugar dehydrogenase [Bacteroidota bacterium]